MKTFQYHQATYQEGEMKNVRAAVLAAGEGTRMKSRLSKLLHLHPLNSQALVEFTVNACVESGVEKTIIVVGHQAEKVRSILGERFEYVYQEKRLVTGDALKQAASLLKDFKGELVVVPGDACFITSSVLIELVRRHRETKPAVTVFTALLRDPGSYGRIVRNGYRQITRIVEAKDAHPDELKIKEINSGIYCFDTQKMLPLLSGLSRSNRGGEYYLTDVIKLLNDRDLRAEAMRARNSQVVLGVNTPEELSRAWRILGEDEEVQGRIGEGQAVLRLT